MNSIRIHELVEQQREYFLSGATLDVSRRILALGRLRDALDRYEPQLNKALRADLGKSSFESYMCEVGMARSEISWMLKHGKRLARPRRVRTPLAQTASHSYELPSPYGVTLIMSPWNYPVLLSLEPLADAIAAGNTVILKPSAYSPHVSAVLKSLLEEVFDPRLVSVVQGSRQENQALLEEHFDLIFFTGSPAVGREVMAKAARHLTPVVLELGGKSPCIVDETADLPLAARRIVFGKYLNCGQTCVAPDYILVQESVHDAFLAAVKEEIGRQYGRDPLKNRSYGRIVNEKHFHRLMGLLSSGTVVWGGQSDEKSLRIAPTVLDGVTWDDPVMGEEIFGPILPILTYRSREEVIDTVNRRPRPLALYLFTSHRAAREEIMSRCSFGGGCVNDTIIHIATCEMRFGGVGESGMGSYHGKAGFDAFSHHKSIVDKKTWLDLPMRYQPYRAVMKRLVRMFLH